MKRLITILFFTLLICSYSLAQDIDTDKKSKCPTLKIIKPKTSVKKGEEMKFTLEIEGDYDKEKIKIYWISDKGRIASGQNTLSIIVITDVEGDMSLTANAYIEGFPKGCTNRVTETLLCSHCGKDNELIFYYELGKLSPNELIDWFDKFWTEIEKDKSLTGYIILYGTPKEIEGREKIIRRRMMLRAYDYSKMILVNGREKKTYRTRFWLAPKGADFSNIH